MNASGPEGIEEFPVEVALRIGRGDRSSESVLAAHFSRRVFAMALSRVREEEAARDLTQDILTSVIVALRAGRLREADRLTGFVLATARNRISNHFREQSRRPSMEEATETLEAPPTVDRVEVKEQREHLRKALDRLDGPDREILRLNLIESERPEEIGRRMGLSTEAVRQRKSRALRKLFEWMERFRSQRPRRVY